MLDTSPLPSSITPAIRLGTYIDRLVSYVAHQVGSALADDTREMVWDIADAASDGDDPVMQIRALVGYLGDNNVGDLPSVAELLATIATTAAE